MDPKKILIVEDSEIQAVATKRLLIEKGYEVSWAKDGAEGLRMARDRRPDLIISDIIMPVMDGYEMCRELKNDETLKKIPLILLTQLTEPEEVIRGLESGADHYFTKPFDEDYLCTKVALLLTHPDIYRNNQAKRSVEFEYVGKLFEVHAGRAQTLSYLISTYENAILTTERLAKTEEALRALNESLEEKVKERTAALRLSEARYRVVTESASDAIICINTTDAIYLWNKKAEEMFGYTAEEALGKGLHELIVPEKYREKACKGLDPFFKAGEGPIVGKMVELTALKKDGTEFPIELSVSAMKVNGEWHSTGIVRDITARKKAEEELRASEVRYRRLFEAAKDGILILDAETGMILDANPFLIELLGYSHEELVGKSIWDIRFLEDLALSKNRFLELQQKGYVRYEDLPLKAANGQRIYVEFVSNVYLVDNVKVIQCNIRDITERKKSEEFIKSILESVDEGFIVIDRDYRIIIANRAFSERTGMSLEYLIGKHCYEVSHHCDVPCWKQGENCAVKHVFDTGEFNTVIHTHHDSEGTPVLVETKAYPHTKGEFGKVMTVIEILVDITKHKKLEDQLLQAQKMEAVGQLAGGIAHDFNNILSTIIGYGYVTLMKMAKDDPLRLNIEQLLEAADRAAQLTHSILAFSRKQILDRMPVDMNEIVRKVEKFLKRIIGEDIMINITLSKNEINILADSGQLEQVFMNLATNARDAMPNGGLLAVETALAEMDNGYIEEHGYGNHGKFAVISVSDSGMGMDEQTRKRIFEPFFTTKEVGKGTGLGLAMVYGIIKQHDGYINVYSELGKGTTFRIYLPVIASAVSEEEKAPEAELPERGEETILLAEDDKQLKELTTSVLQDFGYTVIVAVDGEDAVKKFMENKDRVQLLLFDLVMPRKSGKEAYDEIRAMKPDVKIIFSSGYAPDIIRQKGLIDDGISIISKPASPVDLLRKIRSVLDG